MISVTKYIRAFPGESALWGGGGACSEKLTLLGVQTREIIIGWGMEGSGRKIINGGE